MVPECGTRCGLQFQSTAGVEWRRLDAGVERDVLRIDGVNPDDPDGPGSENRTRFFALLGVSGGVDIPRGRDAALDLERERDLVSTLARLFLERDSGLSSTSEFGVFGSAIV